MVEKKINNSTITLHKTKIQVCKGLLVGVFTPCICKKYAQFTLGSSPLKKIGGKHIFQKRHSSKILLLGTWRIISFSKKLGSPPFISHGVRPLGRGPTTPGLGDENVHRGYGNHGYVTSWEPILQVGLTELQWLSIGASETRETNPDMTSGQFLINP